MEKDEQHKSPLLLRKHRLNWFYVPIWNNTHHYEQMSSFVVIGKRGSGKSYIALSAADDLDVDKDGNRRFSIDRVYFSAGEFAKGLASNYPAGTVHVLDDAGLNLFSREAMMKNVKDIAKIIQSVRYKNCVIIMTLPAFKLLDKVVRQLFHFSIRTCSIDTNTRQNVTELRKLSLNPFSGEVYRIRPIYSNGFTNTLLRYPVRVSDSVETVNFDAPREDLIVAYKHKKEMELDALYQKVAEGILARETVKPQKELLAKAKEATFLKIYNEVIGAPNEFGYQSDKGFVVDVALILQKHPTIATTLAEKIAKLTKQKLLAAAAQEKKVVVRQAWRHKFTLSDEEKKFV